MLVCSTVLLLIQSDPYVFTSGSVSRAAPVLTSTVFTLLISSFYNNTIWTSHTGYTHFISYMDLIITALLIFIHITFVAVIWTDRPVISDRWTVFLTPVAALYIFFATSYSSYVLGIFTIIISIWLMKYKLELKVHR